MKALFSFFLFLTISHTAFSQVKQLSPEDTPGKGKVEDLNWMVGYWTGPGLGGECEEVWMPAVDGHMIGTFRFWQDGKLVFSEFMNLVQDGESITMKLKHFSADLTGWEEKEEWTLFKLIELQPNLAFFDGLTIKRTGNEIVFSLNLNQNGKSTIEEFRYSKKSL